jgi:glycosyltransferase involved in cell wall biosynthesis
MKDKVKILYVVNHAAFFVSHRLPIALAARDQGYAVDLLTGQAGSASMEVIAMERLKEISLRHQRVFFRSAGLNPVTEFIGFIGLISKIYKIQPTLIHCISPKGIIYGGLAARFFRTKNLVLAISGMGFAFTQGNSSNILRRFISKIYALLFAFVLRHPNVCVIVQNEDDKREIIKFNALDSTRIRLIAGSGVDLEKFIHSTIDLKAPIVLLPARMLWDKGVGEFIEAAKQLKGLMPEWRFILAGAADYENPTSVPIELLEMLNSKQVIEWVGHVDDMTSLLCQASIVCLPSYREGMPKCLLEGAAAGCAIVTTDAIGCRDAILPGKSGLLVPVRDSEALKNTLYLLMCDRELRESFGRSGRELAINKFGIDTVIKNSLSVYRELLNHG